MKSLILRAIYQRAPLYDDIRHEDIDLYHFSITQQLKDELRLWSDKFNQIVNFENPSEGYIASSSERKVFIYTGYKLKNKLMKELALGSSVKYYPILANRNLQLVASFYGTPFRDKEPPHFIKIEQIPIAKHLKYEINQWIDFYKKIIDYENPKNEFLRNSLERKNFIMQGYELQNKLIQELRPFSFVIDYVPIPELRTLRLMADYDSVPLTDPNQAFYTNIDQLPLSESLKKRLEDWDDAYVATLNQEYPPDSDFSTPEERKKFIEEGYALQHLLQEALKDNFVIEYEPLPEKADV